MNKVIRVFPVRTSYTPIDKYSFVGMPPFNSLIPEHDEIHISVTFTWDKDKAEMLKRNWQMVTDKPVLIGGPAYNDPGNGFLPGMYVKQGVTFTSRGCPNHCEFCFVPKREGKLRELPIIEGNEIADNNILACSTDHINKVFEMLKKQKGISFKGGLESKRLTSKIAEMLRCLSIKELWLACDKAENLDGTIKAIQLLKSVGFTQGHIRCYVLIGFNWIEEEYRLKELFKVGCLPFTQLFQPEIKIDYSHEWKTRNRTWSRPAAYKTYMANNSGKPNNQHSTLVDKGI